MNYLPSLRNHAVEGNGLSLYGRSSEPLSIIYDDVM